MEFLDLIETIRAEDASPSRLYAGEGVRARRRSASGVLQCAQRLRDRKSVV